MLLSCHSVTTAMACRGHAPSYGTVAVHLGLRRRSAPCVRAREGIPRAASADVAETETSVKTQHVVCCSFDALVDATAEVSLVAFEAARRFWPEKIPGSASDYADVFAMLAPCLEESSSFEAALMVRVMAEENLAARTRFRLELKDRKQKRLKMEAAENQKMERAVTTKQREKLEEQKAEREQQLAKRREEYKKENERLRNGMRTRPLNLREVVAGWDEIKLHASIKFGVELETNIGWEGRTVQPAGLQSVVNDVREEFSVGCINLSQDDTGADDEDEDDDTDDTEMEENVNEANLNPKETWLRSHNLHHGALEFIEACVKRGHEVVVLGGPGRSAKQCSEVLTHLGVEVEPDDEDAAESERENKSKRKCRVVGAEYGSARGLAVAAMMHEREQPHQRWHLVDASLAELTRVASSGLPQTSAFTAQFASWTPALHADKVRAELQDGVRFVDHDGLFNLVGCEAPPSVMDGREVT